MMALGYVFHISTSPRQTLHSLRTALEQLGLAAAFDLDCDAMLRSQLHVSLRGLHVLGVYDPLWMLEGRVVSGSFGLLAPLHVTLAECDGGTEIQILHAHWLCQAGLPAGTVQPLLRTLQKLEEAVIQSGARRIDGVPATISRLSDARP